MTKEKITGLYHRNFGRILRLLGAMQILNTASQKMAANSFAELFLIIS